MKKILMFCVILMSNVLFGVASAAATTGTIGNPCSYNGDGGDFVDREARPIACERGDNGRECYLYCDNGELKKVFTACLIGFYPLDEIYRLSGKYKQCVDLKTACLSTKSYVSGGRWHEDNKKCDCGGQDQEWSDTELKCVESEDYKKCMAASDATWKNDYGCVCTNSAEYYWNLTRHECVKNPTKAECEGWQSHMTAPNKSQVNWNIATNKCECITDADGKAIGNPDDYYVDELYRCVKKPYVLRREEVERNKPAANGKQGEINAIINDLNQLSDDMGKSHWKNASGGFNTARLASDSVAGVVLGTVGGVITSNIIKKNQVKGGFEDINCTVGGQRVAGFADEFNVGIQ